MDISIITPCFHGRRYLLDLIKTVERNVNMCAGLEVELILVNDSPDEDIETGVITNSSIITHVLNNPVNMGIQASRIRGLQAATGKYVLMLDQDDSLIDTALLSQYQLLESDRRASAVLSNGYTQSGQGTLNRLYRSSRQQKYVNDFRYYFYFGNIIASPGLCLLKREAIPSIWKDNLLTTGGADDWLLWAGFLADGHSFLINPKSLYTHKKNDTNFSDDNVKMLRSSVEALNIFKKSYSNGNYIHYCNVYSRRLHMRKRMLEGGLAVKIKSYLQSPDIAWFVFKMK